MFFVNVLTVIGCLGAKSTLPIACVIFKHILTNDGEQNIIYHES